MTQARPQREPHLEPVDIEMPAGELLRRLEADEPVLVLDVRDPEEYEAWHVPGAVNLPLDVLEDGVDPVTLPGQTVVTVCGHGRSSARARNLLAERGYPTMHLEGGMLAWNSVYHVEAVPNPPAGVRVFQFNRVGRGCLSYLVVAGDEALVIDPGIDVDRYVERAEREGARLVTALDTHAHADHVSGGPMLAKRGETSYLAPEEAAWRDAAVHPRDVLAVSDAEIQVLAAPGHTPGSVCYRLNGLLFTGDTLFVESVGRPDLGQDPIENGEVLWRTLHERVLLVPSHTRILPGHTDQSEQAPDEPVLATLAHLETGLAALSMTRPEFLAWIGGNLMEKPDNFEAIKAHNTGEARIEDVDEMRELEMGPNRCAVG